MLTRFDYLMVAIMALLTASGLLLLYFAMYLIMCLVFTA